MASEEMERTLSSNNGVFGACSFVILQSRSHETVEVFGIVYAMIPDAGASEFLRSCFSLTFWGFRARMDGVNVGIKGDTTEPRRSEMWSIVRVRVQK